MYTHTCILRVSHLAGGDESPAAMGKGGSPTLLSLPFSYEPLAPPVRPLSYLMNREMSTESLGKCKIRR